MLVNIKLKTGKDILGVLGEEKERGVIVSNPVEIEIRPEMGFFAKSYLLFSDKNEVEFKNSHMIYCEKANESAKMYYDEFLGRLDEQRQIKEIAEADEDSIRAFFESHQATKH